MLARVIVNKAGEARQRRGHPWVYEGEIVDAQGALEDGAVVDCYSRRGQFLGRGYYNGRSKIRLRVLTRDPHEAVDEALLRRRLAWALARRQRLYPGASALRLVHAEADGLPGLTVDRYAEVLVLQCTSLAMDLQQAQLVRLLQELTGIPHVYARNDHSARRNDGLALHSGFLSAPFPTTVRIAEHGLAFDVDVATGHKTGFYLDQMDNHLALRALVPAGAAVLDAFCYTGAFALHAAAAGAGEVLGLEVSEAALALARHHAELNRLAHVCRFEAANAFDRLRQLVAEGRQFDVVILDPPSFTQHRAAVDKALSGYKEINLRALKLLRPGGVLLTFTCSYYIERARFVATVAEAAADARRQLIVRQHLGQALHHPEVLAIPETGYLKGLVGEVW
ncbi:MAG: SAM-dependent methyltransferase [Candidatus Tectimicrobiota bacterium]|nr:MAG: SAM-dependent methyltransferase [Candidatus Tectomicrobia bacterium]